jgi:hypothetical protein
MLNDLLKFQHDLMKKGKPEEKELEELEKMRENW